MNLKGILPAPSDFFQSEKLASFGVPAPSSLPNLQISERIEAQPDGPTAKTVEKIDHHPLASLIHFLKGNAENT